MKPKRSTIVGTRAPGTRKAAFTLIELLVVAAIIAILAAIAVPNFLQAATRAKVSRVKADMRTFAIALESYAVDHNAYPYPTTTVFKGKTFIRNVFELTTPVAYISSVDVEDMFRLDWDPADGIQTADWKPSYHYYNYSGAMGASYQRMNPQLYPPFVGYCLSSVGPDRKVDGLHVIPYLVAVNRQDENVDDIYDPTNGSVSSGDIGRWTGRPTAFSAF